MKITLAILVLCWVWIMYELINAPEYDENENPVKKK
tara:strand:- start:449 stop:556 length:108 start_codon:yes stop_codon:yes gene_type:complete